MRRVAATIVRDIAVLLLCHTPLPLYHTPRPRPPRVNPTTDLTYSASRDDDLNPSVHRWQYSLTTDSNPRTLEDLLVNRDNGRG